MTVHTPGPWTIEPLAAPKAFHMISAKVGVKNPLICGVEHSRSGPIDHDQARVNARLIAAAPDLLLACQGLLALAESGVMSLGAVRAARAAIAKATGGVA